MSALVLLGVAGLAGVAVLRDVLPGTDRVATRSSLATPDTTPVAPGGAPPAPAPTTAAATTPTSNVPAPASGPNTYVYAPGQGAVLGSAGPVRRFVVAVETGIAIDPAEFARAVDVTLGDERSWIGGHEFRLQRVSSSEDHEFVVSLATRGTSQRMCARGGVDTDGYTSCRTFGQVWINLDRWLFSVPDYVNNGLPLEAYRLYVINHEVGHQLGHHHELCPGPGRPAPTMQTQTLGLKGCTANAWPYVDGKRYAGRPA